MRTVLISVLFVAVITSGCATTGGQAASEAAAPLNEGAASGTDETPDDLPVSGVLFHEDGETAVIYGKGYAYAVEAPEGWTLEREYRDGYGYLLVLYPEDAHAGMPVAFMYARADAKRPDFSDIQEAVNDDTALFEESYPGVFIKSAESQDTLHGLNSAEIRLFYYTYYEAVAYIEEENAIMLIVLHTGSNGRLEETLPAFRELVGSYYYMGDRLELGR